MNFLTHLNIEAFSLVTKSSDPFNKIIVSYNLRHAPIYTQGIMNDIVIKLHFRYATPPENQVNIILKIC